MSEATPPKLPPSPLFGAGGTALYRAALGLLVIFILGAGSAIFAYFHAPWWNRIGYSEDQPVLFSHRHHAGELHIDCRFCHSSVEKSSFAGLPPTETCLTCHSQIFTDTAMLRPVVASAERGVPLRWQAVTRLPDHVFFNHSIHIAKGVGCTTCHGEVGEMPLMEKATRMDMRWCLDCHRNPAQALRPRDQIFASDWKPPADQAQRGKALMVAYHINTTFLTDCSTCHR